MVCFEQDPGMLKWSQKKEKKLQILCLPLRSLNIDFLSKFQQPYFLFKKSGSELGPDPNSAKPGSES
jgi:hypothetical protein